MFGCTSYDFIAGGTGSGNVNRAYTVSLQNGLENAGYQLDKTLENKYNDYIAAAKAAADKKKKDKMASFLPQPRPEELLLSDADIQQLAKETDIAVITIGRNSGEGLDRTPADFNLKDKELQMLHQVTRTFHASGKKVVVILNIGGAIETASWKTIPDAILLAWQAGQEGGNSVADILSGKASPSGKLAMTLPLSLNDIASSANFPMEGKASSMDFTNHDKKKTNIKDWDYTDYEENIYVGYRYFDSFNKKVSYPFGFGLSYTTFDYSSAKIESTKDGYSISLKIQNTGKHAGKEIVELYVSAPKDDALPKPAKELKDFAKTKELQPGESTNVTLYVKSKDLASYNEEQHEWIVAPGIYQFLIGSSSRDIKAVLKSQVTAQEMPTHDILKLQQPIQLLKQ